MTEPTAAGVPTCYRHAGRETGIRCQRCERPICPDCMRDAAVGFQCPSCVSEGAKQTRSGRTAYGGARSANPALTSMALIATNAAVWLAILATGWHGSDLIRRLALVPVGICNAGGGSYFPNVTDAQTCEVGAGGTWLPGVSDGAFWQLLTSAFTHVDLWHIGFNMVALWVLGPQLEMAIGRARFLALYLLSALAGSTVVYWLAAENGATLGASGATFGLMGALLIIAHKVGGDVRQILTWLGINVVITVLGSQFISWQAHLGGLLGGMAIAAVLVYAPRARRTAVQLLGLGSLLALLVVLIVLRTAALA
ncbi:rhomboid family intramembrane serine protease [Nocardioides piscis]|uniref:Rhomboid family intramembrane serine protease n=1 Tax=Nocardioides piscis TaxID=2714938 RepID=A0A6G7YE31_9ACTN|nr:rhomboid family intramembrane serine protease [Nocardioides piscis]QIK74901.1 rhomboid family intramembrane serine protease [Nocardioides piscis]